MRHATSSRLSAAMTVPAAPSAAAERKHCVSVAAVAAGHAAVVAVEPTAERAVAAEADSAWAVGRVAAVAAELAVAVAVEPAAELAVAAEAGSAWAAERAAAAAAEPDSAWAVEQAA